VETLGLAATKNYTKYVQLDRDYLAAVVSASAADSFERHEWWFPVVGKVPYKGFFIVDDARTEAAKLEKRGLDVWVRGVDAFSTLGWFSDPLYSFMRDYSVDSLAELIIHESLHATLFLNGHSQFNEELAAFVGEEGARLYMDKNFRPGSPEIQMMSDTQTDSAVFIAFIQGLIAELEALYARGLDREEALRQKEALIAAAQERFAREYEQLFKSDNYRGFADMRINNAYLELYRLYYSGGDYLRDLYERSGGDLPAFIAAAKKLAREASRKDFDPARELAVALGVAAAR
jgi:predicted aminopeptidase